ncbi:hypothetical protein CFBP3846_03121 [Pseudomonas syringae pv. avii]|uniref:Uncharacterized protein n=2 Tax=Pseudomonas syringae group TaxID=136849 RepID=A0ABY1U7W2_PSESX|nr:MULTISPECIES: hypothetical protein [Pseudomonas syringae group]KKI23290.1 hypothetical protein WX98_26045 [Pseudomonas syringae pv. persicae]KWT10208.1 hypothetical protein AL046_18420 [Pseudomonas syringae pv. avii]PHN67004.1 hypothetical protein AO286_04645 [Pseudomonas syringae]POP90693.1 hypothetical protein CXB40_28990 [Pseudomonas syringae pv. avii]RML61244.1 hypothetical protein APX70_05370 [Pseudomonas syringae pv. maculicola]
MESRGTVIHAVGKYQVYEVIKTYLDNTTEIIGHRVEGPGADSTSLLSKDDAVKIANDLSSTPSSKLKI